HDVMAASRGHIAGRAECDRKIIGIHHRAARDDQDPRQMDCGRIGREPERNHVNIDPLTHWWCVLRVYRVDEDRVVGCWPVGRDNKRLRRLGMSRRNEREKESESQWFGVLHLRPNRLMRLRRGRRNFVAKRLIRLTNMKPSKLMTRV